MIKELFLASLNNYSADQALNDSLWREITDKYSGSKRYYHTLLHLEHLTAELIQFKDHFRSWDTIVFSIVYHDIVYNALKKNNEEKSAGYAEKILHAIHYSHAETEHCKAIILATKNHQVNDDKEINLFTDADLSILGSPQPVYVNYAKQIRKEYSIYPDFMYRPGRQKTLNHFLQMKRIFKTDAFFNKHEAQARVNLQHESVLLTEGAI